MTEADDLRFLLAETMREIPAAQLACAREPQNVVPRLNLDSLYKRRDTLLERLRRAGAPTMTRADSGEGEGQGR